MSHIVSRFALGPSLVLTLFFSIISTASAGSIPAKGGWLEVTEEEIDATEPRVDPDASVELLLRDVQVDDNDIDSTRFKYYIRAKIFSEAGIEEFSKVDLAYMTGWFIRDVRARVINPDGTITELDRKEVYKKEIIKDGEFESQAKSFSLPNLQVGSIVEYRWTQVRKYFQWGLHIDMRAEWPTWVFNAKIKPFRGLAASIRFYNAVVKSEQKSGNFLVNLKNQPAISDKPRLAARMDFEPFLAMVYAGDVDQFDSEKYWGYRGGSIVEINKSQIKGKTKRIKDVAAEIFEGLDSDEDKLRAAYAYCTEEITNISSFTDEYTEEELDELKSNASPVDTLMRGYGNRFDVNAVFASLCQNQGIDAYMSNVENRKMFTYKPYAIGGFNLSDWMVAVRTDSGWRFFDPGSSFLPFGVLNAENAGVTAIVADKKYYYMTATEDPDAADSRETRIADVTIDEYGDLTADVSIQYKGYSGIAKKRVFLPMSEEEREDHIEEHEWQARLARAEVSDLEFKNLESRENALVVKYTVKISGYADVLGNRILFNPSLFVAGSKSPFTHEERTEPMAFDYLSDVRDRITLSIPEGFKLEGASGEAQNIDNQLLGRFSVLREEEGKLIYNRKFNLKLRKVHGHNYGPVKETFDHLVSADAVVASLTNEDT